MQVWSPLIPVYPSLLPSPAEISRWVAWKKGGYFKGRLYIEILHKPAVQREWTIIKNNSIQSAMWPRETIGMILETHSTLKESQVLDGTW